MVDVYQERPQPSLVSELDSPASGGIIEQIALGLRFLRRRYRGIIVCFLLCLPFGGLYYWLAPRSFTASASMLMETQKSPFPEMLLGRVEHDTAWVDSQIGILKSQNVAAYVAKQLRLADDPLFVSSAPNLIEKLLARIGLIDLEPQTEAQRIGAAVVAVMAGLDIRRQGQGYLLNINFRGPTPELAAKVANAMVDGYIYEQLNAKYQANRRAGDWLQERLQALREQSATAERAVVEFKAKNNIVAAGGGLMNEQQLTDISGQLAKARAQASDVQIRLRRIEVVRQAYRDDHTPGSADETVTEEMNNPIISSLRGRYLELMNRAAEWSAKYGEKHNAVVNARSQLRALRSSIRNELERIEETYKSELEIAQKRQTDLEKGLASLISQSTETNQAQVTLFSLDAAAKSYRKLYDSFLQRHAETVQQQSLPMTDARLLTPAAIYKLYAAASSGRH